jgi:hypothetical protein
MYKCNICPAEFKTEKGLSNHKCRWFCKICGTKLTTLKGYNKHLHNHSNSEIRKQEQLVKQAQLQKQKEDEFAIKYQKLVEMDLFKPLYNSGDNVIVSTYIVTKPTHEQRFNRMVRVRYEEERRYDVFDWVIDKVIEPTINDLYIINNCIELNQKYPIHYLTKNFKTISELNIFKDRDKANEDSEIKSKQYKDACDFASMCR